MNFHERSERERRQREEREQRDALLRIGTTADLLSLQPGAILQSKVTGEAHVVTANYGDHLVAVRTQHVTNPDEWTIVHRGPKC